LIFKSMIFPCRSCRNKEKYPNEEPLFSLPTDATKSGDYVTDKDAVNLSHVGQNVYEILRKKYGKHHLKEWDVSQGKMIGKMDQTPRFNESINDNHSDWFPEKICEIISRTKHWCDILSLSPPDGLFLDKFKEALQTINSRPRELDEKGNKKPPIIIRIMFGNLIGMPTNCNAVIKELTEGLPTDESCNIRVWVGAWRRRLSWNHAKIIAVDGRYLHTGGHNLWDRHYLKHNPVHDLSLEIEGEITHDAHIFANFQWAFIKKKQNTRWGQIAEKFPDSYPTTWKTRVIVSEFPVSIAKEFPDIYTQKCVPSYEEIEGICPVIAVGRLGAVTKIVDTNLRQNRPSDYALVAMINSAMRSIKMVLQDLGPIAFPGTKVPLPGLVWPRNYLQALAHAIWRRNVVVNIILSNPQSRPDNLQAKDGAYGNGYSCVDVAAKIVKQIQKSYPRAKTEELRKKVAKNLFISFIRREGKTTYEDGATIGLHSKHFIVDDTCFYVGSQNLYYSDLAEWGVIIDNAEKTADVMAEYWDPMWSSSYTPEDCDLDVLFENVNKKTSIKKEAQIQLHRTMNARTLKSVYHEPININDNYSFYEKEGKNSKKSQSQRKLRNTMIRALKD